MRKSIATTLVSLALACGGQDRMTPSTPVMELPVEKSYPVDIPETDSAHPQRPGYPTAYGYLPARLSLTAAVITALMGRDIFVMLLIQIRTLGQIFQLLLSRRLCRIVQSRQEMPALMMVI